jgi:hypothetical protein
LSIVFVDELILKEMLVYLPVRSTQLILPGIEAIGAETACPAGAVKCITPFITTAVPGENQTSVAPVSWLATFAAVKSEMIPVAAVGAGHDGSPASADPPPVPAPPPPVPAPPAPAPPAPPVAALPPAPVVGFVVVDDPAVPAVLVAVAPPAPPVAVATAVVAEPPVEPVCVLAWEPPLPPLLVVELLVSPAAQAAIARRKTLGPAATNVFRLLPMCRPAPFVYDLEFKRESHCESLYLSQ